MSNNNGVLYVVSTPIGHLKDITFRAVETLQQVDLIAAEDTRHSKTLLDHYSITTPMISYHDHNESHQSDKLIEKIRDGQSIALISDAGTPLISDPGFQMIQKAKQQGLAVVPVPGASAVVTALSASGLASDKFSFIGFVPRTSAARKAVFETYLKRPETFVFYESSHRILNSVQDLMAVFEPERRVCVAREMTKTYETIVTDELSRVLEKVTTDTNMQKGEFVVLVEGVTTKNDKSLSEESLALLKTLLTECSVKTAVKLAVEITGESKKQLYQTALQLQQKD